MVFWKVRKNRGSNASTFFQTNALNTPLSNSGFNQIIKSSILMLTIDFVKFEFSQALNNRQSWNFECIVLWFDFYLKTVILLFLKREERHKIDFHMRENRSNFISATIFNTKRIFSSKNSLVVIMWWRISQIIVIFTELRDNTIKFSPDFWKF